MEDTMVRRSYMRSRQPRIRINEEIKKREKQRLKKVRQERNRARKMLRKMGVTKLNNKRI